MPRQPPPPLLPDTPPVPPFDPQCGFFEWCDAPPTAGSGPPDSSADAPPFPCPCGIGQCKVKMSRTSKNPDRQFYVCPQVPSVSPLLPSPFVSLAAPTHCTHRHLKNCSAVPSVSTPHHPPAPPRALSTNNNLSSKDPPFQHRHIPNSNAACIIPFRIHGSVHYRMGE